MLTSLIDDYVSDFNYIPDAAVISNSISSMIKSNKKFIFMSFKEIKSIVEYHMHYVYDSFISSIDVVKVEKHIVNILRRYKSLSGIFGILGVDYLFEIML